MKLEVGKFIRTPYGIRKIVNITKDDGYGKPKVRVIELDRYLNTLYKFNYIFYTDENVIKKCKASYNIIEILKEGDYVNGCKVIKNTLKDGGNIVIVQGGNCFTNEEIKSVITHEQMEQIAYKVSD